MRLERLQGLVDILVWIVIACGAATLCVVAVASLRWEFAHDTPLGHYAGLLIVRFGRVPYRDFFETVMPGAFAFHALIVWLFGPGNVAFAVVNLVFLALVLGAAWAFLAQVDRVVATAFGIWYALNYLGGGPTSLLQRDFLALLPIAAAMALVATRWPHGRILRPLLCGLLFGLAATIKPQLAVGAPLVILADIALGGSILGIGISLCGFALPIAAALVWLASNDALAPFIEIVTKYLPLYVRQNGEHVFLPPQEHRLYLFWNTLLFGSYWRSLLHAVPAVAIALWVVRRDRIKTVLVVLSAAMTVVYGLLPTLAGQFWNYHYFPFVFFLIMTLSFLLLPLRQFAAMPKLAILCAVLLGSAVDGTLQAHLQLDGNQAEGGRVARMEKALSATLKPGETVQPIDATDGVIHTMLRLGIPIATPFFYDSHFYHDVDDPEIQTIRQRFLEAMEKNKPTYIVEATKRPRVSGVGTAATFPAFDQLVSDNYHVVHQEEDFRILKRND
jgi:hypothetical protein